MAPGPASFALSGGVPETPAEPSGAGAACAEHGGSDLLRCYLDVVGGLGGYSSAKTGRRLWNRDQTSYCSVESRS